MTRSVSVASTPSRFRQRVVIGPHHLEGDESEVVGGMDVGPSPEELLLSALGTCINITLQMYASRKEWPLAHVAVRLSYAKVPQEDPPASGAEAMMHRIDVALALLGELSGPQRDRLYEISQRCPLHRMLAPGMDIHSQLLPAGASETASCRDETHPDDSSLPRAILEQLGDAAIYADPSGTIALWNAAAATLFGHSAADAVGQSLDLIVPEDLRDRHWAAFKAAMANGALSLQGRPTLTRAKHSDGHKLYVEMTFALVKQSGRTLGAVAVARDASERVAAQRAAARRDHA